MIIFIGTCSERLGVGSAQIWDKVDQCDLPLSQAWHSLLYTLYSYVHVKIQIKIQIQIQVQIQIQIQIQTQIWDKVDLCDLPLSLAWHSL